MIGLRRVLSRGGVRTSPSPTRGAIASDPRALAGVVMVKTQRAARRGALGSIPASRATPGMPWAERDRAPACRSREATRNEGLVVGATFKVDLFCATGLCGAGDADAVTPEPVRSNDSGAWDSGFSPSAVKALAPSTAPGQRETDEDDRPPHRSDFSLTPLSARRQSPVCVPTGRDRSRPGGRSNQGPLPIRPAWRGSWSPPAPAWAESGHGA